MKKISLMLVASAFVFAANAQDGKKETKAPEKAAPAKTEKTAPVKTEKAAPMKEEKEKPAKKAKTEKAQKAEPTTK